MEIVTYVMKGAITHQDNVGNQGRTEAGQIQVMSAGTGIVHAEYNREAEGDRAVPDLADAQQAGRDATLGDARFPRRRAATAQTGAIGLGLRQP